MSNSELKNQVAAQPGIFDAGELAKILGDDCLAIKDLTLKYQQLLKEQQAQIQQALAGSDWESAASLAHQLKSSSRVVGAFELADCCESIEFAGKSATDAVPISAINDFGRLTALVLEAVEEYLRIPIT